MGILMEEPKFMKTVLAYSRVSSQNQFTENQRRQIESRFQVTKWFIEEGGVSGSIPAASRPAMLSLLSYARENDTVVVVAIDRLGRSTIDVLNTVQKLQDKGVSVVSIREGFDLSTPAGKLMLTMLAAVAELERSVIKERQMAGILRARAEGKHLGRTKTIDEQQVSNWRRDNKASIRETAQHFNISTASISRACRLYSKAT
jgi:putative DNA-invertase from lambdoid prophage Rac